MSDAKKATHATAPCKFCRHSFEYALRGNPKNPDPPPSSCGMLPCRCIADWSPEEWEGQARMAHARQLSGIELNDLDLEALRRSPLRSV